MSVSNRANLYKWQIGGCRGRGAEMEPLQMGEWDLLGVQMFYH